MSFIVPIPQFMLGMTANLNKKVVQSSLYDERVSTETIELINIGIDRISTLERGASDTYLGNGGDTLLYFDVNRSLPYGTTFSKYDEVVYQGNKYVITEVDPARDETDKVHHYEVLMREVTDVQT